MWLDPRPLPEDLGKAYAEYFTHASPTGGARSLQKRVYDWLRAGHLAARHGLRRPESSALQRLAGRLLWLHPDLTARIDLEAFHLPRIGAGRFLEIGCGNGEHLAAMQDLGWTVEGMDVDPAAVEAARSRGLDARCGMLEELGWAPGSFDAIGMSHVIEHVDDPAAHLGICHSLLAPGGRLVLITPNSQAFGAARYGPHWLALDPPRHLRVYSCASLQQQVEAAGFRVLELRTGVRDAHIQFMASDGIRKTDRWTWGERPPLATRLGARLLQCRARLRLLWAPRSGEEIVLVAER